MDPQAFWLHEGKLFMAKQQVVDTKLLRPQTEKRLHRKKQNGTALCNVDTMHARLLEVLAAAKSQLIFCPHWIFDPFIIPKSPIIKGL